MQGRMSLSRRRFLSRTGLGGLFGQQLLREQSAHDRPNILLAISDDQSWLHTSVSGDPTVKTPAFDRVAREGALFTHAFCSSPSCSPSRASLLTGQDFWRLESGANLLGKLRARFPVYPRLLAAAGYAVGYTGKSRYPRSVEDPCGTAYDKKVLTPPAHGINPTDYAGNFEHFLSQRDGRQPFCFWYGGWEPHRAYEKGAARRGGRSLDSVVVPPFLPDREEVRIDLLDYYLEIEWFDQQLGRMIEQLERIGELERTIIVVTSDNGMPFPRAKTTLYDYGVRIPLAIRWPGGRSGRVLSDFVLLADLAPTFLELAGVLIPEHTTGKSLLPLLLSEHEGRVEPERDRVFIGRERHGYNREPNVGYPMRALRTDSHLYIRNYRPERWPMVDHDLKAPASQLLMNAGSDPTLVRLYELAFARRPSEELYDLKEDPVQMNNMAGHQSYSTIKNQLRRELDAHLRNRADPRAIGDGDVFDTYEYHGPPTGNHNIFQGFQGVGD